MDLQLTSDSFGITRGYSCYIIIAVVIMIICLMFELLCSLVLWYNLAKAWFDAGLWWLFVLPPIALIMFGMALICFMRRGADKVTFKRHLQLYFALKKAKQMYLANQQIILKPGQYGAWIEIITAPPPQSKRLNLIF